MIEFIDKTETASGTPLNRETLMAVQGFITSTLTFNADGSITETNSKGEVKTTVFNADGSITETFKGVKTLVKTIVFDGDEIREVIS